ncbi:MAG TPA: hypothetical protein VJ783_19650 [Pirellulales bacterium]|nr:hypothetical protein [Pirellulales bacterium]
MISEEALSKWFAEAFQVESVTERQDRGIMGWIHSWFGRPQKAAEEKT